MAIADELTAAEIAALRDEGRVMETPPVEGRLVVFAYDYADAPFGRTLAVGMDGLLEHLKMTMSTMTDGDEIMFLIKRCDMTPAQIDAAPLV